MVPCYAQPTFEDATVTDPAERLRLFWQEDHVRIYGPDIIDRIKEAGFGVSVVTASSFLSSTDIQRMNLTVHSGDVFFCTK